MTTLPLTEHKREVLRAWLDGKTPQRRITIGHPWSDFDPNESEMNYGDDHYRIKPTPTRRFWRPEEIPVGWQAREVGSQGYGTIILATHTGEVVLGGKCEIGSLNFHYYEVAPPGPANQVQWQPAGVEE